MRILTFADYFLPGFKAGGPIRTIANMVERMGHEHEFLIFTRDRDLGASSPYHEVQVNTWNPLGEMQVFYASPGLGGLRPLRQALQKMTYDVLYLNSFFSWRSTIFPLILRRFGLDVGKPVVLAPRGEFSAGALGLKSAKKCLYLALAKQLGIYRRITWQASSENEAADIRRVMGKLAENIVVAPNLLPFSASGVGAASISSRLAGPLRIVFLSRISPMKNLDYLIRVMQQVRLPVVFNIFGPAENETYWAACRQLMTALPANVKAIYHGAVSAEQVGGIFAQHDLFVLPTRGENFGHVIIESLNVGTPVLLSDRTPWQNDTDGALEVLSLDDPTAWALAIERRCGLDADDLSELRRAALAYAGTQVSTSQHLDMNRKLFESAIGHASC
jgi:glycosyltransferase involved in cell wall biosynthesis